MGPVNPARRTAQVEATVNTMQEGHTELLQMPSLRRKMEARGPGCLQGSRRATQLSAVACNVKDWMQGLDERVSYGEVRQTDDIHAHE